MTKTIDDIIIIGGGPTGLFAAFYAGMRGARVKLIESLEQLGGQPRLLYPEKSIYDIPAYPAISGQELADKLEEQLQRFDFQLCLAEEVLNFEKTTDGLFQLKTNKQTHHAKAIILAIGAGAFQARKLKIKEAQAYEQANLHYLVKDIESYRNLDIVINGGGDSAVDWALALEEVANSVTVVHRRDKFRALDYSVQQMRDKGIHILTPYEPYRIEGDGQSIQAIHFKKRRGEDIQRLEADVFIVNYGFHSSLGEITHWPIKQNRNGIQVDYKMESSIENIFAIGDVCDYPGKIDLIATGFGEAPIAVNHAIHAINPQASVTPEQSTSLIRSEEKNKPL